MYDENGKSQLKKISEQRLYENDAQKLTLESPLVRYLNFTKAAKQAHELARSWQLC
jgi:hypothetical protein